MKRFVSKLLLFIFPIILAMFFGDYYISNTYRKNHEAPGEIEVWNDIYNGDITADIAIYGSSRAYRHIDPDIVKSSLNLEAYNFGMSGHNFWLQYLRHQEYLKYNNKPKFIILSVDIFSLQKREDLFQSNQFLPFMLWNQDIKKYTSSYLGFTNGDYYFPLVRYSGTIRTLKKSIKLSKKQPSKYRKNGYKGAERSWNNDLSKAKKRLSQYKINIDTSSVDLFDQFLSESKEKNIKVILIYTPEYIEGQEFVENREEVISIYEDFAKRYNLCFLDYSNDILCTKKELFYNSTHLNIKGAEIFTRKLSSDLRSHIYHD